MPLAGARSPPPPPPHPRHPMILKIVERGRSETYEPGRALGLDEDVHGAVSGTVPAACVPGRDSSERGRWLRSRTAFNNNVGVAYECLSASGRKKKPGLDGRTYGELLKRICRDGEAPEEVVAPLLRKIQCRDHEAVPLDVFRAGMLTCFVLLEFVARAGALFQLLEGPAVAVADRRVGQAVLDTLEGALQASDNSAAPACYLEAGSRLGPDSLALAMDRAMSGRRPSTPMTREEFLEKAAALFIAKVKPVG
nr:tubulin polyglutamylase complex subunit 1 isoform X3 [Microcebus murinus]